MSGNFSSSSIYKLTKLGRDKKSFGQVALTYIQEKKYELKLGRYLNAKVSSRPTDWGNICEPLAFDRIGLGWKNGNVDGYKKHPKFNFSGIKDIYKPDEIGDIKCSYTLKSYCQLYEALESENVIESLKSFDDGYKYYWQLVSGCILDGVNKATLAIFMPYKGELSEVREQAFKMDITWLNYMTDEELPYLIKGKGYENILERSFEIPKSDKEFLLNQIEKADKLLKA